ncbi:MAG: alpha/beta hydrolase [Gammaproteobacteria bacterium]|nr:alpha/beta fold hydrolase [Pseudomonadales bacterium]MCP5348912.1 alpha/beta fold hydrolase [Pseudomonadales bacterium]
MLGSLLVIVIVAGLMAFFAEPEQALIEFIGWRLFQADVTARGEVRSGQAQLHYQIFGKGKPVVLLHGGASLSEIFMGQIPELSRHFRVITTDSRGQGRSSRGVLSLTYHTLSADVFQVMDSLGVPKADVVGWSDGGITGLVMTLEHPERIGKLVAISANRTPEGISSGPDSEFDHVPGFISWLAYRLSSPHPEKWQTLQDELVALWTTLPQIRLSDLAEIANPVLLIAGEHDIVSIPHLQEMQNAIPDSRLAIVRDAGHDLLIWHSRELNDVILGFLQEPASNENPD